MLFFGFICLWVSVLMNDCDGRIQDDVSVVLTSPEAILLPRWTSMLKTYRDRICLQVYDEAHCISSWGLDFRPTYRRVSELQSLISSPTLVLTATATPKIQEDIYDVLSLDQETEVIANIPDRPNIFLDIVKVKEKFKDELSWLVDMLKENGVHSKKTIIYVRSINTCSEIYLWMCISLGLKAFDKEKKTDQRLIEMFHANTDEDSKARILETFVSHDSKLRMLISTVAFGMGVNVPDISLIIHWGLPSSALNYWQETGRCARDGREGYAVCYAFQRSITKCEDDTLKVCADSEICVRYNILTSFLLQGMNKHQLDHIKTKSSCDKSCTNICKCQFCTCCFICWRLCTCKAKANNCRDNYV